MPKRIPEQELDAILAVVAAHPEGVQVSTIREGLPYELPPRMLQRRLALLVEQKRLIAEGQGKGRRYRVPGTITGTGSLAAVSATTEGRGEIYVPISPEAERSSGRFARRSRTGGRSATSATFWMTTGPTSPFTCRRKRGNACSKWAPARRRAPGGNLCPHDLQPPAH
jgi:hypothetical protein